MPRYTTTDGSGWWIATDSSTSSTASDYWGRSYIFYDKYFDRDGDPDEEMERKALSKTMKKKKLPKERDWHEAAQGKKRIEVFDFDDTLVQSAKRPEKGQQRHGWNGKDWWGSEASLSFPLFQINSGTIHKDVISAMTRATQDRHTLTILLTGRRGVVAHMVRDALHKLDLRGKRVIPPSNKKAVNSHKAKLDSGKDKETHKGFHHHHQFFCGDFVTEDDYPKNAKGKPQHGTMCHKTYIVQKLMHEDIEELVMWDDRDDHIRPFIAMGLDLKRKYENLESVAINRVFPIRNNDGKNTCTILNIPIKHGMSY